MYGFVVVTALLAAATAVTHHWKGWLALAAFALIFALFLGG